MVTGHGLSGGPIRNNRSRFAANLMKSLLCAVSVSLAAASAHAAGEDRFDLVCHGVVTRSTDSNQTTSPWDARYRLDMTNGKVCHDDCRAFEQITDAQSNVIQLLNLGRDSDASNRTEFVDRIEIDRTYGNYYRVHDWDEMVPDFIMGDVVVMHHDEYSGTCEPRAFSDFPATTF